MELRQIVLLELLIWLAICVSQYDNAKIIRKDHGFANTPYRMMYVNDRLRPVPRSPPKY